MEEILEFYKSLGFNGKRLYNYLEKHIKIIDFKNDDDRNYFVGCNYKVKDGILKNINIIVPEIKSLEDTAMCVHEIGHFMDLYPYLNKEFKEYSGMEIFPISMERLFFESRDSSYVLDWFNKYQNKLINESIKNNNFENMMGFLNHFEYVDLYYKVHSVPKVVNFNLYDFVDLKQELKEKAKVFKKSL